MSTQMQANAAIGLGSLISGIATLLRGGGVMTAGDVAALRRMDPRHPATAFFKIEGVLLDAHLPGEAAPRTDLETRWAAIIAGLAHLGSLHRPGQRLGNVLADAQYSELRFARLVRADKHRLLDDLPALARFLAAKQMPVDWTGAAQLILSVEGKSDEAIRRHIARDYYGALARSES